MYEDMTKRPPGPNLKSKRTCIFCGGLPLTTEDVIPTWIHRQLGRRPTTTVVGSSEKAVERIYANLAYTTKVNAVCARCNNGWMATLEGVTKILLSRMFDEKLTLQFDDESKRTLACWTMKTALMLQLVHPLRAIPQDVYADFYKTRVPPRSTVIYIARRRMERNPTGGNVVSTDLNLTAADGSPQTIGIVYGVTFFIQNIAFQVVGFQMAIASQPNVEFPQEFRPFVQRLWPTGERVIWPPLDQPTLNEKQSILFTIAPSRIKPGPTI